jgi:hypothetical protein
MIQNSGLRTQAQNSELRMESAFGNGFEFGRNTPALTQLDSEY